MAMKMMSFPGKQGRMMRCYFSGEDTAPLSSYKKSIVDCKATL